MGVDKQRQSTLTDIIFYYKTQFMKSTIIILGFVLVQIKVSLISLLNVNTTANYGLGTVTHNGRI